MIGDIDAPDRRVRHRDATGREKLCKRAHRRVGTAHGRYAGIERETAVFVAPAPDNGATLGQIALLERKGAL
jgi:hypothetical protein